MNLWDILILLAVAGVAVFSFRKQKKPGPAAETAGAVPAVPVLTHRIKRP